ncbi:MAG: hypothetical protein ACQGVK_06755 [Myxococcota bacterium]
MTACDRAERPEAELRSALARLGRRRFLGLGLATVSLALWPTGCGDAPAALRPAADTRLRRLSPRAYATFTAAAMRIAGPTAAAAIAAREIDVGLAADRWADREPGLGGTLSLALGALEFGIPPLVPKWRPFTGLAGDAQDAVLARLLAARLDVSRDIARGVRSLVFVTVYGDPLGARWAGHPGPTGNDEVGIADAMTYDLEL